MARGRLLRGVGWLWAWVLILVVLVFLVIRVGNDLETLSTGNIPAEGEFDRRYALNPVLAYAHILPGVVFLIGAPLQLSRRVRTASLTFHRVLGRVVIPAGLVTAVFAIAVGIVMPFGGMAETTASVAFGSYFLLALILGYRAALRRRIVTHRRWMIRAFALGIAVGLIRIIVGILQGVGTLSFAESFGVGFWMAFVIMALAAELWLKLRPRPTVIDVARARATRTQSASR